MRRRGPTVCARCGHPLPDDRELWIASFYEKAFYCPDFDACGERAKRILPKDAA